MESEALRRLASLYAGAHIHLHRRPETTNDINGRALASLRDRLTVYDFQLAGQENDGRPLHAKWFLFLGDGRGWVVAGSANLSAPAWLGPGHVHIAQGGLAFVLPILAWARRFAERVWLRIDAGFPEPELLETLEQQESVRYVARLKTNAVLERLAAPHLQAAQERAGARRLRTHEPLYRAGSWETARRVVLVIRERADEQGSLFADPFFLLSNATAEEMDGPTLLVHHRQRGVAEKEFGEWNQALDVALSSSPRPKTRYRGRAVEAPYTEPDSFAANEARLLLSLLAANLLHAGAALLEGEVTARMSRARFREVLLKSAARVRLGGRRIRVVIEATWARLWVRLVREMNRSYPVRGSPRRRALLMPA